MNKIKFLYMILIIYFCGIATEIIRSFESSSFIRVAIKRQNSLKVAVQKLLPFLLFVINLLIINKLALSTCNAFN